MTSAEIRMLEENCRLEEDAFGIITQYYELELTKLFTSILSSSNIPHCKVRKLRLSEYPFSTQPSVEFWVEGGFYNESEEKFDFASEFSFNYNVNEGLKFNQSTAGYFGKEDKFQCLRALLISYFITNLSALEAKCNEFSITCSNFIDASKKLKETKNSLQNAIKEYEEGCIKELLSIFKVGMVLLQRPDISYTKCIMSKAQHTITKVTPKYVTMETAGRSDVKISKETLARALFKNEIMIVSRIY